MAVEIFCRKLPTTVSGVPVLKPETQFDLDQLEKLPLNKSLKVRITQGRSDAQQRLYWRVLALVVHNTSWPSTDALHHYLRCKAGLVDYVAVSSSEAHIVPKSTSYGAMDQTAFNQYVETAFGIITTVIMPGTTVEELRSNIGEPA